jgi:hypothetical protein
VSNYRLSPASIVVAELYKRSALSADRELLYCNFVLCLFEHLKLLNVDSVQYNICYIISLYADCTGVGLREVVSLIYELAVREGQHHMLEYFSIQYLRHQVDCNVEKPLGFSAFCMQKRMCHYAYSRRTV